MSRSLFAVLLTLIFYSTAGAQFLTGIVVDESGFSIAEVHVQIEGTDLTTITDEEGQFRVQLTNRVDDNFKLLVSRVGFDSALIPVQVDKISSDHLLIVLQETVYTSETVVVTATRTKRDIEEVSIPVSVVSGEEIQRSGSMRLSDILSEQTGMQIVNDHGTGLQVQGFNPDYTLIMIDGNPVIGRTAGTLDLTRISVRNVEQIEIVKGPSSALWGSDALAGVVNIITQKSIQPFSYGLTTRYGENNTFDVSADISANMNNWNNDLFINRNSSGGYSLNSNSISQTVPEFENYTVSYKTDVQLGDRANLEASVRYFTESQDNLSAIELDGSEQILDSDSEREDFIARPVLNWQSMSGLDVTASWMTSFYKTDLLQRFSDTGETFNRSEFNQYYNKPELKAGYRWGSEHHTLIGSGLIFENLESQRYPGQPHFTTQFGFAQHSWTPNRNLELTGGFRFDAHSEYSSQLSPKGSARYRATDWIQFRASAGRGFKAPEFRQLFLNFTNATAGYSVFGASAIEDGINQLDQNGEINQILIPISSISEIQAESSWSVNTGFDLDPFDDLRFRLNLFRNDVDNLIEAAPIARKSNGQSVFTYFNVDEVRNQGLEAEIRWRLSKAVEASAGYQFLDARSIIVDDRTVQNSEGDVVQQTITSFEPMFNRSKHSGNFKLFYESDSGWGANIRGILRGRYGIADTNGNGFVDNNEYESGFILWNIAASRSLTESIQLQAGVDNLFGYTDRNAPHLSGSLWYMQLGLQF